jgi:prephenate dehydratase
MFTQDKTVRLEFIKEAFQKMPKGEDYQLIPVENAGHIFTGENLEKSLQKSVEWFQKYL